MGDTALRKRDIAWDRRTGERETHTHTQRERIFMKFLPCRKLF
jgi:hypothetical protein